jgi:hypothetical protein
LNARGEPASPIWLTAGLSYKFVFAPSTDTDPPTSPIRTIDNVSGVNDTSITIDQWIASGLTPTYVTASSFTVAGDQTSNFQVGRRIKATVTAGTVYGTISSSAFGALTTVGVTLDSGALDSGLSAVSYGILTNTNPSLPAIIDSNVQSQKSTYFTTGGTSTAYTLTPIPAIASLVAGQRFNVNFNATAGVTPTLAISGLTAKSLKIYDGLGVKQSASATSIISAMISDVEYDGTDYVVLNKLTTTPIVNITVITANGNFTTPANITTATVFKITLIGGGGGGGGTNGAAAIGGGGGAGGVITFYIAGLSPSTAYAVLIGAAGTAGGATGTSGGTGGTTQITLPGPLVYTALGGVGGVGTTSATIAKTAAQGSYSINAATGVFTYQVNGETGMNNTIANGAGGASTPYGTGGYGGVTGSGAGVVGTGNGIGGGGGIGAAAVGGAGTLGLFIAEWVA